MRYNLLAIVAGCLFGAVALLLKQMLGGAAAGPVFLLIGVAGTTGFALMQLSLKHGRASHVMLLSTAMATMLPVGGGIALLGEVVTSTEMTGIGLVILAALILLLKKGPTGHV